MGQRGLGPQRRRRGGPGGIGELHGAFRRKPPGEADGKRAHERVARPGRIDGHDVKWLDAMDGRLVAVDAAVGAQRHDGDPGPHCPERRRGLVRRFVIQRTGETIMADQYLGFALIDDQCVDLVQESWIESLGGRGIDLC